MCYADNTKGYRVYNKLSKKIEISRTIQLQENNTTNYVQIQYEENYRSERLQYLDTDRDIEQRVSNANVDQEMDVDEDYRASVSSRGASQQLVASENAMDVDDYYIQEVDNENNQKSIIDQDHFVPTGRLDPKHVHELAATNQLALLPDQVSNAIIPYASEI